MQSVGRKSLASCANDSQEVARVGSGTKPEAKGERTVSKASVWTRGLKQLARARARQQKDLEPATLRPTKRHVEYRPVIPEQEEGKAVALAWSR